MPLTMKAIGVGLVSHLPGFRRIDGKATGGTNSARYCYATWMRHFSLLCEDGHAGPFPTMVELGPGDSIGVGIAAMLSGVVTNYIGLDVVRYASPERDLLLLDELVDLFRAHAPIPDDREFPGMFPRLASYDFRYGCLPAGWEAALSDDRVSELRAAVRGASRSDNPNARVRYIAPWSPGQLPDSSVDLTISQTVLQLVDSVPDTYREMARWTKPGGIVSHEIDFKSLGRTAEWNGHWAYSDKFWSIMQKNRTNRINRAPYSKHAAAMEAAGFDIFGSWRHIRPSEIDREKLAPCFAGMDDLELTTASALIQAVKGRHRGAQASSGQTMTP